MRRPTPTERPPLVDIMRKLDLEPDPWQVEVLESNDARMLLNCCRQAGKSTVVAILGLIHAMWYPMTRVVIVSRSQRQSGELLRLMKLYYRLLGEKVEARLTGAEIELANMSRIVSLPCREDTIRGYAHVDLLIIDEAARVPDDLYRAVRPMLAVSKGRLICLSTPYGKRGFFWEAWARGGEDWRRFEAPASACPRISAEFLEQERRAMGEAWFRQEYCCSFEALEGLVYPDFAKCIVDARDPAAYAARLAKPGVGGMDFGFRNPFAAVWGFVDRDGVLWLTGEHYVRQKPLSYHVGKLPGGVMWYADPSGASEIAELKCAGLTVRRGNNALRPGIMAVTARLQAGTLKVVKGACPNLLAEAGLYRYAEGENPEDGHDHALDALRYLICGIDARRMGNAGAPAAKQPEPAARPWLRVDNEALWAPINPY